MALLVMVFGMSSLFASSWLNSISNHSGVIPALASGSRLQTSLAEAKSAEPVRNTNGVSPVLTNTIYLPMVYKNPEGLFGYVTENASPVSGLELTLFFANHGTLEVVQVMTTTTNENGVYQFMNVPSIQTLCGNRYCINRYFVYFQNAIHDPQRIDWWQSNGIFTYTQNTNILLGNFDIGRPELIIPIDGDVVTSTIRFRWTPRDIVGDDYAVDINKANIAFGYRTDYLGSVGEYMLDIINEVCPVVWWYPCSDWYGDPFTWSLFIRNGMGEGGATQEGTFTIQP